MLSRSSILRRKEPFFPAKKPFCTLQGGLIFEMLRPVVPTRPGAVHEETGAYMQQRTATTCPLRLPSVLGRVPVSTTEWHRKIIAETAPAPIALPARSVASHQSDIDAPIARLAGLGGAK